MTGSTLLVPPRSAFKSREELCAFVSYKMRRATELFTFKCSLYQRELKLYLPEPVPKHRRWIDTFDSESIVTIPVSKIEKDEIELFRRYFPDDMDLDSTFPGDLLQRSFKKRISSLLTSLVNKIVFLLVLKHDTWYVHQEARDGLREYLVEKIWPKQPKMRLLYRDHVTTFVDTRIRHFRDSVGRYFRDLHANSKNGEAVASLIVTCDYKQSELDEIIKKALEEQETMFESEKQVEYVSSPKRNHDKEYSRSLLSLETSQNERKAQKSSKHDQESFGCLRSLDSRAGLGERYEEITWRSKDHRRPSLEDLELCAREIEREIESYPSSENAEKGPGQDQERRLLLKMGTRQKHKLRSKQHGKDLGLESEKGEDPDGESGCQWRDVELEKSEEPASRQGDENRGGKRPSSSLKSEQEAEAEAETELELELELGERSVSNSFSTEEANPLYSSFKRKNLSDDYMRYYSLHSKGIQVNHGSQPDFPIPPIPSIPSIQSISSSFTSTMSTSSSFCFPTSTASSFLSPNFVPGLNLITNPAQINPPIDKSSMYSSFLFPQSNLIFTTNERNSNTENSSSSNTALENNTTSNIVYRNIQADSSSASSASTENGPLYSLARNLIPESGISSNSESISLLLPVSNLDLEKKQKEVQELGSSKSSPCLESAAVDIEVKAESDTGRDLDSKSNLAAEAFGGYSTAAPIMNFPCYFGSMKDYNSVLGSQLVFPQQISSMFQPAYNVQAPHSYFIVPNFNYPIPPPYPAQGGAPHFGPYWLSSSGLSHLYPFDMSKSNCQPDINQMNQSNSVHSSNL